jgi:hypothetical protein
MRTWCIGRGSFDIADLSGRRCGGDLWTTIGGVNPPMVRDAP